MTVVGHSCLSSQPVYGLSLRRSPSILCWPLQTFSVKTLFTKLWYPFFIIWNWSVSISKIMIVVKKWNYYFVFSLYFESSFFPQKIWCLIFEESFSHHDPGLVFLLIHKSREFNWLTKLYWHSSMICSPHHNQYLILIIAFSTLFYCYRILSFLLNNGNNVEIASKVCWYFSFRALLEERLCSILLWRTRRS